MFDSTCETNIPILRKPFSGNLPPKVPTVASDNMGGVTTDGDGNTSIQAVYVDGRVIKPITGNLGGYDGEGNLRCVFISDGKFVQSDVIESLRIIPFGIGTVPIAKVILGDGSEFYINAPAGGSGGGGSASSGGSGLPLLSPMWLDYINSTSECVPVEDAGGNHCVYAGVYRYQEYGSGGVKLSVNVFGTKPATNDYFELVSSSGYASTYRVKKAGRYLITSNSGRVSHGATSMALTITHADGSSVSHNCPAGQKYVYSNPIVYDLSVGDTIYSTGSYHKYSGTAAYTVELCPPSDEDLYEKSGDTYKKATQFDANGTLADGVTYYSYHGTSVSGQSVAYPKVYDHLLTEYNAVKASGTTTDTYTLTDGTKIDIPYYRAADQHKICIYSADILNKLNRLYNDPYAASNAGIGEAWYYVLRGSGNESFWLPRTRYGFHGANGYAKIGSTTHKMFLHFIVN
jgi:hypothetical protein